MVDKVKRKTEQENEWRAAQSGRLRFMFDPYLTTEDKLLTEMAQYFLAAYELKSGRKRQLKAKDRENAKQILLSLFANLARAFIAGEDPPAIGISLKDAKRKRTRYDRPEFSGVSRVVRNVEEVALAFELEKSTSKGTASRLNARPMFVDSLRHDDSRLAVLLKIAKGRETIRLSRVTKDYANGISDRELIDYADTDETRRFRSEMNIINAGLGNDQHRIELFGTRQADIQLRFLQRSFVLPDFVPEGVERFDLGGRLFGISGSAWWQALPSDQRWRIRLDRERIADLDFQNMALRLAFLAAGAEPPQGDLYSRIPGLAEPRWREGAKKLVSAMLFRSKPLVRLPKGLATLLPPRTSAEAIRAEIFRAFPELAGVMETGAGLHLMFRESEILVAALLDFAAKDIPALPMHDGVMVPQSKANIAGEILQSAASRIVGFPLPVVSKTEFVTANL